MREEQRTCRMAVTYSIRGKELCVDRPLLNIALDRSILNSEYLICDWGASIECITRTINLMGNG